MNLKTLISSLSDEEKSYAFRLLAEEILKEPKIDNYITIDEFCRKNKNIMTTRLKNVLLNNKSWIGNYIESINSDVIHRLRNASLTTQAEFIELRGY